ncbi:hypothetical protein PDIG_24610 [Penicillium digitatum PHI26]|uniref:Uncharacterized protein n=2 Tax=Penicillium digitatum TaxID=36651 RepID=K9G448_PEND2|nr:hypothetical protein PDIP_59090 [Penicillium digitatum Pd1]EKV10634.1 hypothetical protein PDIP_59090 [Penicillium digitatum Pd1]EKV15672.1 hypothetical protein PDIG_24610 [Penicillium digitatum PHI26]
MGYTVNPTCTVSTKALASATCVGRLCHFYRGGSRFRGCLGLGVSPLSCIVIPQQPRCSKTTLLTSRKIANVVTEVVTSFVADTVLPVVYLLLSLNRKFGSEVRCFLQGSEFRLAGWVWSPPSSEGRWHTGSGRWAYEPTPATNGSCSICHFEHKASFGAG